MAVEQRFALRRRGPLTAKLTRRKKKKEGKREKGKCGVGEKRMDAGASKKAGVAKRANGSGTKAEKGENILKQGGRRRPRGRGRDAADLPVSEFLRSHSS